MGRQGLYHRSWLDLWHQHMVAVLLYSVYQPNTDMGIGEETLAYLGGIQHHLGMDFMHGTSTAFDMIICTDSSLYRDFL